MLTPSSSAVVAASPTRRPSLIAASRSRRSSGRYPDRYAATLASGASWPPSDRRAASATVSAPRRDRMKASVGTSWRTSRASRSAVCAVAVRRSRAPTSPRAPVSGGSHSANASGPRGEPSSVTSSASSPVSSRAQAPGVPTVAEASTNTGRDGSRARSGQGVMRHHPAQPPQHVSHVRAEHPAVLVTLVDDHVAQPAQEPGPAGVPGKQRLMEHVRRGQQVPGVTAGPVALGPGRVAVERGGLDPGQAQGADRGQLIGGQRLGRRHVQHGLAGQHRGQRGQQVAERLARRRAGGDDHVPAGLRVAGGLGLMGPGGLDAAACEGTGNLGGNPRRPRHLAPGPGRDVLHVHGSPGPRVVQQDAQRPVPCRLSVGRLNAGIGGSAAGSAWARGVMVATAFSVCHPLGDARRHDFV